MVAGQVNYEIYDCGCVVNRPKEASCKAFGTRWRVYISRNFIILKCRDCGRRHKFQLVRNGVQMIQFGLKEEEDGNET
jgi:hypothetical protein